MKLKRSIGIYPLVIGCVATIVSTYFLYEAVGLGFVIIGAYIMGSGGKRN